MTTTLLCNEVLVYRTGLLGGREAQCHLHAWRRGDGSVVAVATDLNSGLSVTNSAEWLWGAVRDHLQLPSGTVLYSFEHYPYTPVEVDQVLPSGYDAQQRRYTSVEWKYGSIAKIEQLLGHPCSLYDPTK